MNELWVARDDDGTLTAFDAKPEWCDSCKWLVDESKGWETMDINPRRFPNLRPGECKRLVLAEE